MANRSASFRRRRRRRPRDGILNQIMVPAGLIVVVVAVAFLLLRVVPFPHAPMLTVRPCPMVPAVAVGTISVPAGPIAGYCQPQLVNAAQVILAAQSYGLTAHGQEIGVMTAIGESGLRNVDYGDTAGPDSRGLFQQRSNYGALADRMDPYTAARAFFLRMTGIVDWPALSPTQVAHTVQRNADPDYYTQYWKSAVRIVTVLNTKALPSPSVTPTPTATPIR